MRAQCDCANGERSDSIAGLGKPSPGEKVERLSRTGRLAQGAPEPGPAMFFRSSQRFSSAPPRDPAMNRTLSALALLTSAVLANQDATAQQSGGQNVLVIIADDLGTDKLRSYSPEGDPDTLPNTLPNTPTIDALAANGISFDNAWACPVCSPTRASILTGRYPFRHGVTFALGNNDTLALEEITLPEVLDLHQIQGGVDISTGAIGKWHLSSNSTGGSDHPNLQGFDHFEGILNGAPAGPDGYFGWLETINGESALQTNYATTEQVDDALKFIEGQDNNWFCWLAFNAPHTPFHAPPAELHNVDLPDVDPQDEPVPFFNAMTEAMDTEMARLFAQMDPQVLANTVVIFVADNGTTGDVVLEPYDPNRSKGSVYTNGVRVPLIVSGPGILLPGRRENSPVDVTDLFATSLELLGVNDWQSLLPPTVQIDSVSLRPYLTNLFVPDQRDFIYTEVYAPVDLPESQQVFGGSDGLVAGAAADQAQAYREGFFKLVLNGNGSRELYNLAQDPLETNNLISPPFLASDFAIAKTRELTRKLQALIQSE